MQHWSMGAMVHGPVMAWGQQRGTGYFIEEDSSWVLPPKNDTWTWSDHVKDGVRVMEELCATFGIFVAGAGATSSESRESRGNEPQRTLMDRSSTNFNLLRTKYSRVEWDNTAKVKDLTLHIHDQRLLSEYEWVSFDGGDLPSEQGMFFMPDRGTTFYVTGRLQYFWVYYTQFRRRAETPVRAPSLWATECFQPVPSPE